ncbi:glycosyltransferase [Microbacterium betulae]|uniref:Glycosyltransferase n=1 Tax=Microbacterium betulae TaxID=2981139 RepID=A0AA97FG17_9MICO|nr:glycosyltransferase [Microbacterium sp. AB]WOF22881.1 glycosyltransferase [Microbacterium sp. AB]
MNETISVVIPVLDDARLLERCLASLAAQTRRPDEVIVVDNGSTDDSVAVARAFGATVVHERRRGITAASSHGFDVARGTVIARCDADSLLPPTWVARIERSLASAPDAVAVTGPATFYDLHGVRGALARRIYVGGYFLSMRPLLGHNVLFGSNCAVRAHAWRALSASVPRDDSEIHDDMDLSYRLPPASRVILDRSLVVGISARPFDSLTAFGRRLSRAVHTFSLHLPQQLPHRRWTARWRSRARRSTWIPIGGEARA